MDLSFVPAQLVSGLTTAMTLFVTASGLSLIFGVMGILNFAHGSLFMLGAFLLASLARLLGASGVGFVAALFIASVAVGVIGAALERWLISRLYGKEELFQLLFTYSLVLVLADCVRMVWGVNQQSVMRPAMLSGSFELAGATLSHYNLLLIGVGFAIVLGLWFLLHRTRIGELIRAASQDREMLLMLGKNVRWIQTGVFALGAFLAGLSGALMAPLVSVVPGMDSEIIIVLFIIVVIGGLGSLAGTLVGSLVYGVVYSFTVYFFPQLALFVVAALMVITLTLRPQGLLGRRIG
ncbi:branched-chain amino acid ABC transporter permease [Variovorax sp. LjRoot290]|uniref:branched-chain amino acid ABC transporter permease n=1 Tax=unclassified Variovorax TaxID=663243 RepID=UPI003ECCEA0B